MPPDEARQRDNPCQHTHRSVCIQNFRAPGRFVTNEFVQPNSCKLTNVEEHREPMQHNAPWVEGPLLNGAFATIFLRLSRFIIIILLQLFIRSSGDDREDPAGRKLISTDKTRYRGGLSA
jgi:hypothetical protein